MKSPGRWLKVSLSRQSCRDGIIPVDGSEFWVTVKLPDGIIPVDGLIPVDGCEFWVTVKLPDGIIPVDGRIPVDGAEFGVTVELSDGSAKTCAS